MSIDENNNNDKVEIILEKPLNEDITSDKSNNYSFSDNILQEIKSNEISVITKNFQPKIQQILEYLQNISNPVSSKVIILKYIENLFDKINFNAEIFLKKSKKLNLNLFQVIINQYITNKEENEEYLTQLEYLFVFLLSRVTFDREAYHYMFSFIINYINQCNNNLNNITNNNFNSEQLSKILLLLKLYYQSAQSIDEPYNYLYFNGDPDTYIDIYLKGNDNFYKKFSKSHEINILFFIKLVPKVIAKQINPEFCSTILDICIESKDDKKNKKQKNIIISIDKDYFLCTSYTSKNLGELPENKMISILVKVNLKELTNTEIFIDNEKREISKDIIIPDRESKSNKNDNKIKKLRFFQNFAGICSNIIIYKEHDNYKKFGLPKFFLSSDSKKEKANIKNIFVNGIYKEELFNILIKSELFDKVDNTSYNQINCSTNEKMEENDIKDIKDFLENNLISIYLPNRNMLLENNENYKIIILKDSINGIDAQFYTKTPQLNDVHLFKRFSEDFEPFGGLNHFLPIIELMTQNNNLLENENLFKFFGLISSVFTPSYNLKNENNSNFFFNLSYFLEKIPEKYFDEQLCSKLTSISTSLIYYEGDYTNIIKQFHNNILLNKSIFFKFQSKEQYTILVQIKLLLDMIKIEGFIIDIMLLIDIILTYDEERYNKFCCEFHSEYFNMKSNIYNPELKEILKPIIEIISKLFEIFINDASKCKNREGCESGKMLFKLFEMLTMDISPCLQKIIFDFFFNFMKNHMGKYLPLLDVNKSMFDITLFLFKTSIFDIKIDALNLILLIHKMKFLDDDQYNRNRTNSWAISKENEEIIDSDKSNFIQNYILPFYLLGEEIYVSGNSKKKDNDNNSLILNSFKSEEIILENKDKIENKDKNNQIIAKEEKTKKLNINNFYKKRDGEYSKTMVYSSKSENIDTSSKNNQININYAQIKITPEQKKVQKNYKKEKLDSMISELYNNTLQSFKEKEQNDFVLNLLIKIVSKSDIILICQFLEDLKEKSKNKKLLNIINKNELLFEWLLETSFQIFMIKESNNEENKFKPGFIINPIDEKSSDKKQILSEQEINIKIGQIYNNTIEFIINITKNNIYEKLDYIFSWSKYYYELRNNKNNFQNVKIFLLNILINLLNSITTYDFTEKENQNEYEYMYILSCIFEYLTIYNISKESKKGDEIVEVIYINFPFILTRELRNQKKFDNEKKSLEMKWENYSFYKKIYSSFKPLWADLAEKKKNERDNIHHILKKYIGKKNSLIIGLEKLFHDFKNLKEGNSNKGIKNVLMIFHFFILLFHIVEDKNEINNLYNDFYFFMCFLIISSSTLTISDNKKQKWPNGKDYQEVQDTVEILLFYTFKYYKDKIIEIKSNIKKFTEEKNDIKIKYYNFIFQILIDTFGNLIKLLALIYDESNKTKNILKLKTSESSKKTAPYLFMKYIYSFLETEESNSSKNDSNVEKEENCINNILKLKRDSKDTNSELEKNIFIFINNKAIQTNISDELDKIENKKKLYPFYEIIENRDDFIRNMIPVYNNRLNIEENPKNICLVPDYWQECRYNKILGKKIERINKEFIKEILLNKKNVNVEMNQKIKEYKKIKKKLFTFKGIWSKEEFFYEPKYHIKYKLLNHYTQDFAKILLTPILDMDYYLPSFTEFEVQNYFRCPENQIPIYCLVDLSFALLSRPKIFNYNTQGSQNNELNKRKISLKSNRNILFDLKLINYNFNDIPFDPKSFSDATLFEEYIDKKHFGLHPQNFDRRFEVCLVKPDLHICGIFYSNSEEIGFYSSDRIPSEDKEEYDISRQVCFGSILKPQMNKYNYYNFKISYHEIDFVLKRKYYFKKTCLEIFTVNKKSYFFRFKEDELEKAYTNIKHYMKSDKSAKGDKGDIEDISIEYTKYEDKIGFFNKKQYIKKSDFYNDTFIPITNDIKSMNMKNIYDQWIKWEISTLRLITMLNLYANRSFNDINQYPVFPWISLEYGCEFLSNIIRPFGTPMGMLDFNSEVAARKESFISTWKLSCEENEEESDRYRSHYSTSLYITYYLVRVFPFSSMRIELQGKNFDDPHRLFNSMKDSFWCATTQRADLRELIPEFFYFPEMFYNLNKFELGEIKNKETDTFYKVNDIKMPKWANEDGYIFINMHRMLLESPEVNEKINEWFNIIFGVKQRGNNAKKINNLFLKYTYDEEFEEEYNKEKDVNTRIYYCRMVEFGITPHQIFKYEANKRLGYGELKNKKDMFVNMTEILKKKEEKNLEIINELQLNEEDKNNNFIPFEIFLNKKGDDEDKKKLFVLDNSNGVIKILKIEQVQKKLGVNNNSLTENKASKKILKLTDMKKDINLFIPKNRLNNAGGNTPSVLYNKGHCVALGGFWNGSILIENILVDSNKKDKEEKVETKIYFTKDKAPITHILIDENEIFMLCGNNVGTIYIYIIDIKEKNVLHLYKILYDNYSPMSSMAFDEKLNIFISCFKDGICNLYTTPQYKLVNSFKLKNIVKNENNLFADISLISSSPLPCFIFYFKQRSSLCVCSVNGHFIKEQKIDYQIINHNYIKKFTDNQFIDYLLVLDQTNQFVIIYNIIDLQVIMKGDIKNYILIDFTLSKDFDNLFVLAKSKTDNDNEKEKEEENNRYKIFILKNTKVSKINSEIEKKATQTHNNEEETTKE